MDLSAMSTPQLHELQKLVAAELAARDAQAREAAKLEILNIAQRVGVSVAELVGMINAGKPAARNPAPIKYINPNNPNEKWTGRGRAPKWAAALDDLGQLETARVEAVNG